MASTTVYTNLYENLKNSFTVGNDNCECTLGEYMLMKANEKTGAASLPVAVHDYGTSRRMLQGFVSYVSDKLTIKKPPVKDKTMKAFPLRTSLASLFSALLVCTIVVTYGLVGASGMVSDDKAASVEYEDIYEEEISDTETFETRQI